jgi:hypothetical protein
MTTLFLLIPILGMLAAGPVVQMRGNVLSVTTNGMILRQYHLVTEAITVEPEASIFSERLRAAKSLARGGAIFTPRRTKLIQRKENGDFAFISGVTNFPFGSDLSLIVQRTGDAFGEGNDSFEIYRIVQSIGGRSAQKADYYAVENRSMRTIKGETLPTTDPKFVTIYLRDQQITPDGMLAVRRRSVAENSRPAINEGAAENSLSVNRKEEWSDGEQILLFNCLASDIARSAVYSESYVRAVPAGERIVRGTKIATYDLGKPQIAKVPR